MDDVLAQSSPTEAYRSTYNEKRYNIRRMIRSFRSRDTAKLAAGERVARFVNIERVARRKLDELAAASRLDDLSIFPGNRLKPLHGDRAGQHSIRINDQWRICFIWKAGHAEQVEIVDYH